MIRFIDIRGQRTGYNFSFFDTVTDNYISKNSEYAWTDWEDFIESSPDGLDLERYKKICPGWVFGLDLSTNRYNAVIEYNPAYKSDKEAEAEVESIAFSGASLNLRNRSIDMFRMVTNHTRLYDRGDISAARCTIHFKYADDKDG